MASTLNITWNEAPNGIATNNDPNLGGIIDSAIVSGKWFVIFNDDEIDAIEDLPTREAAFAAHAEAVAAKYWT